MPVPERGSAYAADSAGTADTGDTADTGGTADTSSVAPLVPSGLGRAAPAAAASEQSLDVEVTRRAREPFVVPESRSALELLAEMRKLKRSFAVVVDEYGGVAGVLTINDLVSELVGDIRDELDRARSPEITRIDQNRYLVDGAVDVDEVRDQLAIPIPDGEYVTLGGFLFDRFGRIPEEGDAVDWHDWNLMVTKMDKRRIAKVIVRRPSATLVAGPGGVAGAPGAAGLDALSPPFGATGLLGQ